MQITADKIFSDRELKRFLGALDRQFEAPWDSYERGRGQTELKSSDLRLIFDRFLFHILANTGLRISEALNMEQTWVNIEGKFLVIPAQFNKGKRRGQAKPRTVYFGPRTAELFAQLREFLLHKQTANNRLYFSLDGRVMSRSYAFTRFKYWCRVAGLPEHHSPHTLRHTYATQCLDRGLTLPFVRDNLGHSNISVTSAYLHLTRDSRDKVLALF
jgi:site-specific recombinase XerD